jgi:hypothetical protein
MDMHYIIDNLFLLFPVLTTRTDQLSMALHVILRALLIRRVLGRFDNIKASYIGPSPLHTLVMARTASGKFVSFV